METPFTPEALGYMLAGMLRVQPDPVVSHAELCRFITSQRGIVDDDRVLHLTTMMAATYRYLVGKEDPSPTLVDGVIRTIARHVDLSDEWHSICY